MVKLRKDIQKMGVSKKRKRNSESTSAKIIAPVTESYVIKRREIPRYLQLESSVVVCNSESALVVNTIALGAFFNNNVPLAPFQFSWLSNLSLNYSKFRWRELRVLYVPGCSTATSGTVTLGLAYDNQDLPPASTTQAQVAYNSVTTPSWGGAEGVGLLTGNKFPVINPTSVALDVDVTRFAQPWYPCSLGAVGGVDSNQYTPAWVNVSTGGGPAAATFVGTIFCKYKIEFIEPYINVRNV